MSRCLLPFLLVLLSGCLPSSCSRTDSRALFPSDSLSREVAASVEADTLERVWDVSIADHVEHPRTVAYDARAGIIYVSDTGGDRIVRVSNQGEPLEPVTAASFHHPYLTGFRGDSILVFNAGSGTIDVVHDGSVSRSLDLPPIDGNASLTYAVAAKDGFFFKILSDQDTSAILSLNAQGEIQERYPLPGPEWRHAGLLRMWGDSLVSLVGYRPVVDVVTPDGSLDTLALQGFDSPMLARSRRFMLGDVSDAPLLSSSAAPAGGLLFALNLRAGWIQIDAFDRDGMLQYRLSQPDPQPQRQFYPIDIAANQLDNGNVDLIVLLLQPEPRVIRYLARLNGASAGGEGVAHSAP